MGGSSVSIYKSPDTALARNASTELGLPSQEQMAALKEFCGAMVGTPFLPKTFTVNRSVDQQAGTLLAVVLTGREMGLLPMFSLRAFWLSPEGRLGMYADSMLAIMRSHGVKFKWLQNDNKGCKIEANREGEEYVAQFSIEDAITANLSQKDVWRRYPKAMCRARAIGETFRSLCADMGGTSMYTQEELQDLEPESGYATVSEQRHAEADAAALEDPSLKIVVAETPVPVDKAPETAPPPPVTQAPTPVAQPAASEPPPEPAGPPTAKDIYTQLCNEILTKLVAGSKPKHIKDWLRGWFVKGPAKPTPEEYNEALELLVDTLPKYEAARKKLLEDAASMGSQMREIKDMPEAAEPPEPEPEAEEGGFSLNPPDNPVDDQIMQATGWQLNTAILARETLKARAMMSEDKVLNGLKAFGLVGLENDDAYAYLVLYHHSADGPMLCREFADTSPSDLIGLVQKEAGLKSLTLDALSQDVEAGIVKLLRERGEKK
jgi:hypothetical protein